MITIRYFPPVFLKVDCSMWSWLRYAELLEHSQVHFPSYMSSSFHCSLLAVNSKCDNRGTINSNSRPCSCKVYMHYGQVQSETLGLYYNHILFHKRRFFCCHLLWKWKAWQTDRCAAVLNDSLCVCGRTTWQALSVTSVRLVSSTCQRPTLTAVCVASVWASPNSAPAPLGIEIRYSKLLSFEW